MASDNFIKQDADEGFIPQAYDEYGTDGLPENGQTLKHDDANLLGDLLNELSEPELPAPPFTEEKSSGFMLPVIILFLLAAGVLYTLLAPSHTNSPPAATGLATINHQLSSSMDKPVEQKNRPAPQHVAVPEKISSADIPEAKARANKEQAPSTATVVSKTQKPDNDSHGPPWALNVVSLTNKQYADEHLSELNAAGFAAELIEITINGNTWYRIRIPGFASVRDANKTAAEIAQKTPYKDSWAGGY
ncbi:sporulation related domain protein [Mariprofundus micogutta]|uniref:Sporulation related domain protein n=1 Tax=Mariprofundus micogutta TaxID=1921010 RepID=A0A1L8CKB2_9PROT|nr:SPOR domain-containing protein [Mariprofundus micogutta]GAV19343.1 sporulation related domain protein [Mariprofundus micogutta]